MRRRGLIIGAAVLAAVLALGTAWYVRRIASHPSVSGAAPAAAADVQLITSGLVVPWGIAFLPDGTALVTERVSANILAVTPSGQVTPRVRVDNVVASGEGGLLGIAVAPTYEKDRFVYVYYTTGVDNRVVRLRPDNTRDLILTGIPKAGNHDGGRIAFGPDGRLYIGTGDAGDSARAQRLDNLGGKILRVTADGQPAPGNPFPGSPVYSYGHRNVQGLAWDAHGQLFATEFGQNRYDELNRIEPGHNYGWPIVEGMGTDTRYTNPVATWATSDASPSGLAIVGDRAYLACLRGTKLYRIGLDGTRPQALLAGEYGRLRTVALAPDGALWILTSNRDGRGSPVVADDRILRLAPGAL